MTDERLNLLATTTTSAAVHELIAEIDRLKAEVVDANSLAASWRHKYEEEVFKGAMRDKAIAWLRTDKRILEQDYARVADLASWLGEQTGHAIGCANEHQGCCRGYKDPSHG